jgi:hypothetical protein
VNITAVCPVCESRYQVQPELRGKAMRCPNPNCRKVFVVSDGPESAAGNGGPVAPAPPAPPARDGNQRSGSVGEMVPILPADAAEAPAPPPRPASRKSTAGRRSPPASAPAAPEPQAASWQEAPPVRRGPARGTDPVPAAEAPAPPPPPAPAEPAKEEPPQASSLPAWLEPPPVRRGDKAQPAPGVTTGAGPAPVPVDPIDVPAEQAPPSAPVYDTPAPPRSRAMRMIVLLLLLVAGALGAGGWYAWRALHQTEDQLSEQALKDYKAGNFAAAASRFQQLPEKFQHTNRREEYLLLKELCDLRARLHASDGLFRSQLDDLTEFIDNHGRDRSLTPYNADLGTSLVHAIEAFTKKSLPPSNDEPLDAIEHAKPVVERVSRLPGALDAGQQEQIEQCFRRMREAVALLQHRESVMDRLTALARDPNPDTIRQVRMLIRQEQKVLGDLASDPRVVKLLEQMYEGHVNRVRYEKSEDGPAEQPRPGERLFSLWVDPLLQGRGRSSDEGVVLALMRGVLYSLRPDTGEILWARRVGVDITTLPVRVPLTEFSDERILVLSSDRAMLTALDRAGRTVWEHRLSEAALGRPLIVEGRAYLPTFDGQVHEIELVRGRLLGRFHIGHRLASGGVRQEGTSRIFLPAYDSCVYVLDVVQRKCLGVLHSGHLSGLLRGEPLILPGDRVASGYLVLTQVSGLDEMRLRVFALPVFDQEAGELALAQVPASGDDFWMLPEGQPNRVQRAWSPDEQQPRPDPRVRGWAWSQPAADSEKLVLLSDRARLGLIGIRQPGNRDPMLFSLLPGEADGLTLEKFFGKGSVRERAEVAQVQGDDYWLLAHGKLQRLQIGSRAAGGPELTSVWKAPVPLGKPLHAAQSAVDPRTGRAALFLVTEPSRQPLTLATAVDDEDGQVIWQRQLGLLCQGRPVRLHGPGEAAEVLLVQDQASCLFSFAPERIARLPLARWRSGGLRIAGPLDENPQAPPPLLLPAGDGRSAYQIACPGTSRTSSTLVVRHVGWNDARKHWEVLTENSFPLQAVLAGTPALTTNMLLMPMSDGILYRLSLPLDKAAKLQKGSNWRAVEASPLSSGHVVALGGDRFLITNGSRSVTCWEWPAKEPLNVPPAGRPKAPTLNLRDPLGAPPLFLPAVEGRSARVCLSDPNGVLLLYNVLADGRLEEHESFDLKGRITAGPFLRSAQQAAATDSGAHWLACVVDSDRLVWLDPARPDKIHSAGQRGDHIVGRPELVEGLLIVATESGRFVALDPATGEPAGQAFTLQGSIAPAAAPVRFTHAQMLPSSAASALGQSAGGGFGGLFGSVAALTAGGNPSLLFVPMTDGTVLLLPLDRLHLKP